MTTETAKAYADAVLKFLEYCAAHKLVLDCLADIDSAATAYTVDLFYSTPDGRYKQRAVNLRHGLSHLLPAAAADTALPLLDRSIKGWAKLVRKTPWLPITHELAALLAVQLAKQGDAGVGVAVMTSFSALLRINECLNLSADNVAFTGDSRLGQLGSFWPASLKLGQTKTGDNMWARVQHKDVAELLRSHIASRPAGAKVFDFSDSTARKRLKQACEALGLSQRLVWHGLRHGGATDAFVRGVPLEDVMMLGRWAVTSSTRHYIQHGAALLLDRDISKENARLGALFRTRLLDAMALAAAQAPRRQGWRRRLAS